MHLAECIVIGENAKEAEGGFFVSLITFFLIKWHPKIGTGFGCHKMKGVFIRGRKEKDE